MILTITPTDALSVLGDSIARSRCDYRATLRDLPPLLRSVVEQHHDERLRRSHPRPVLGEYAPWLIADLLMIDSGSAKLIEISIGWQQLCWGVLLLDDIIDEKIHASSSMLMIAANLLIQRGICKLLSIGSDSAFMRASIDAAFLRNASAAATELGSHRNRVVEYSEQDIVSLGDKLALIDICIDAIVEACGRSEEDRSCIQLGFRKLIAGLQLLDDLTDVHEDFVSGNMTLPLTLLIEHQRRQDDREVRPRDYEALLRDLVKSGAIVETLRNAQNLLRDAEAAVSRLDPRGQSRCGGYVRELDKAIDSAIASTEGAGKVILENALVLSEGDITDRRNRENWALKEVARHLEVVAQSS